MLSTATQLLLDNSRRAGRGSAPPFLASHPSRPAAPHQRPGTPALPLCLSHRRDERSRAALAFDSRAGSCGQNAPARLRIRAARKGRWIPECVGRTRAAAPTPDDRRVRPHNVWSQRGPRYSETFAAGARLTLAVLPGTHQARSFEGSSPRSSSGTSPATNPTDRRSHAPCQFRLFYFTSASESSDSLF